MRLTAPFPWFGGKSRVAPLVWERFGTVANYVEPFFGSGAVLLGAPHRAQTETVNDLDCYLANFWRALAADPDAVAHHCDWPVNEADLFARHGWLVAQAPFRERMRADPDYHDAKIAGWWVWGLCSWIGSGWCVSNNTSEWNQLPHLSNAGQGVHRVSNQLPHLGDAGRGVHRVSNQLPHLGDAGQGVHRVSNQLPHLSNAGQGGALREYMRGLATRLRGVRVACGDWSRVLGDSVTWRHGLTGVFLDPPYGDAEHDVTYSAGNGNVGAAVRAWAVANGNHPKLRIALCGYEGEHGDMPESWVCIPWKSKGGYGSQSDGRGRDNAKRERIWFSPSCIHDLSLFGGTA